MQLWLFYSHAGSSTVILTSWNTVTVDVGLRAACNQSTNTCNHLQLREFQASISGRNLFQSRRIKRAHRAGPYKHGQAQLPLLVKISDRINSRDRESSSQCPHLECCALPKHLLLYRTRMVVHWGLLYQLLTSYHIHSCICV